MLDIRESIQEIGCRMVQCKRNCEGISNQPEKGILPRCLFFDPRSGSEGCVIVGINPGKSGKDEISHYLKNSNTYSSEVDWLKSQMKKSNYYKFLTDFINTAGFSGPILWTELVKCETKKDYLIPPMQTFRSCTHEFLTKELEIVPESWPLIAVGREVHKALSYLYPKKSVLGVPHPTSSRGQFANLFKSSKRDVFKSGIQNQIDNFKNNRGNEQWLFQKK